MRSLYHFLLMLILGLYSISAYSQYSDSKTVYVGTKISLHAMLPDSIYVNITRSEIKNAHIAIQDLSVVGKTVGNDSLYLFNSQNQRIASIYFSILPYLKLDSLIITPSSVTCYRNDTVQLNFFPIPFNASISFSEWQINKTIATIDKTGKLTAISEGQTVAQLITYPSLDTFRIPVQVKECKPPIEIGRAHV